MKKFNEYNENLMKVVLVPDESSDSVSEVEQTEEPADMFTKTATDFMNDIDSVESDDGCGCDGCECGGCVQDDTEDSAGYDGIVDAEGEEAVDTDSDSSAVAMDGESLKVNVNGSEFSFNSDIVAQIKAVLGGEASEKVEESFSEEDDEDLADTYMPKSRNKGISSKMTRKSKHGSKTERHTNHRDVKEKGRGRNKWTNKRGLPDEDQVKY